MSFFKSKNAIAGLDPIITVSAKTVATVSNRVDFETQIVEFEADVNSNLIALVSRANTQDYSHRNKKGLVLIFNKNIKSGTYSVTDPDFPFESAYYFEFGTIPGFTTSFQYKPQNGSFTVEAIENTGEKLHYQIGFDFKGVNERNKELKISGKSTYIVLMESR
ncbi:hypothetical protein C5612_04585 [Pseudomonas frederiksbergensis]|uniref:Uncharacterized protein n=1 Tax=Pseudomonas frederiksbergensis TaxID=104087 RepID=A0A2S8HTM5_9PSED|nr:hypothetical protein [Pseudomonas frederiksbergensis]PQP05917.1 hypothetical protein C5612_04585 [Pseudomonas frederiksbergensis]